MLRFLKLKSKILSQYNLQQSYQDFMRNYLTLGHIYMTTKSSVFYLILHHPFVKKNTSKLPAVLDAYYKTTRGSLNDILLTCFKLQLNLCDIITNF